MEDNWPATAYTTGDYEDEQASVAALDRLLEKADLWYVYPEVRGMIAQPRPEQEDKSVRIDRVLVPMRRLIELGWRHGTIGVEAKRSGVKIGPVIAQAMDYRRSVWRLGDSGTSIWLDWCFVWPMAKQQGPIASVLSQQRIGSLSSSPYHLLYFQAGETTVLDVGWDGEVKLGDGNNGRRAGSR